MEYEEKSERWAFENYICVEKPVLWINEAINLRYSAVILNEYSLSVHRAIFDKVPPLLELPVFWTPRIERMLWGYAFENLFKAIIIAMLKNHSGIKEVPFAEIKSHDLIQLAKKANVILTDDKKFYLQIAQKCAVWAGRYPLPAKLHDLPQTRNAMKSREELIERSMKQHEQYMQGKIKRLEAENDVLHSGVGTLEFRIYVGLFERAKEIFEQNTHQIS